MAQVSDPDREAALAEQVVALHGALAGLPKPERLAIHLRFFDRERLAGIAERLDKRHPMQAARIVASGIARLRRLLVGTARRPS